MSLVGRVFSNRYEIQREIAQGGMAEVYLARDQLLDRPVALKALFPEYAREPSFVERFRREAQAAANLNHPNIVAIYDWGQEAGTYFIVMEYVEGRSLRDLIRSEGPLDPNQAAEIAAEIASALAFAHRNGVVHRDVKPGNVLLTPSGHGEGHRLRHRARGHERRAHPDRLGHGHRHLLLARAGAGPRGRRPQRRVLARRRALRDGTGVAPFTGDSPVAVAYKHVREEPIPPSQRNPDVPARPRADHPHRAREGSRPPLPDRRRPARRPPALPARPSARGRAGHRAGRRGADAGAAAAVGAAAVAAAAATMQRPARRGRRRRHRAARRRTADAQHRALDRGRSSCSGSSCVVGGILFAALSSASGTARSPCPTSRNQPIAQATQALEDDGLQGRRPKRVTNATFPSTSSSARTRSRGAKPTRAAT